MGEFDRWLAGLEVVDPVPGDAGEGSQRALAESESQPTASNGRCEVSDGVDLHGASLSTYVGKYLLPMYVGYPTMSTFIYIPWLTEYVDSTRTDSFCCDPEQVAPAHPFMTA